MATTNPRARVGRRLQGAIELVAALLERYERRDLVLEPGAHQLTILRRWPLLPPLLRLRHVQPHVWSLEVWDVVQRGWRVSDRGSLAELRRGLSGELRRAPAPYLPELVYLAGMAGGLLVGAALLSGVWGGPELFLFGILFSAPLFFRDLLRDHLAEGIGSPQSAVVALWLGGWIGLALGWAFLTRESPWGLLEPSLILGSGIGAALGVGIALGLCGPSGARAR